MRNNDQPKISQPHLFELYEQMFAEVEINKVMQKASEVVNEALNAERSTIYILIKETQELKSIAFIGNVSQAIIIPINKKSLAGYCASSQQSFIVPDAYGDLSHIDPHISFDKSWDEMNNFQTRDVICAPAMFQGEVMGVIQVINSKREPFKESDTENLENIGRFVAYALYHAQLYDELATIKGLEKEKAEFMRILVHELRSPVATSKMLVSSALYVNKDNDQLAPTLNRIGNKMDQLLVLVEDILQMSRIKSGRPLGEVDVCNLVDETKRTFENYKEEAESKRLEYKLEAPDTPIPVRIDLNGYRLISSNLISNGVKYTSSGSVHVVLEHNKKWASLKIQDTGMGIPQKDIPNLFTEFYRASNARKSNIMGTGVGLAGVKDLVERFGGKLELITEENKGSEFIVRLPLYAD
jgi:signal transduction histidine kinase